MRGLVSAILDAPGLASTKWVSVGVALNWNPSQSQCRRRGLSEYGWEEQKKKKEGSSPALSFAQALKSSLLQGGACTSICLWCVQIQPFTAVSCAFTLGRVFMPKNNFTLSTITMHHHQRNTAICWRRNRPSACITASGTGRIGFMRQGDGPSS